MRAARLAPVLALVAVACGHSPETTMLTLDVAPPPSPNIAYRGPPITVPAVHVPAALDHAEYASQPAAGTIKLDDFAQWTAPLGILARDALVRDLIARLPAGAVLPPGATGGAGVRTLDVTILSFAGRPDGATLQVAWREVPGGDVHQVDLRSAEPVSDPAAGARALSTLLGDLSDSIAVVLLPRKLVSGR